MEIRWMTRPDMDRVLEIENQCFYYPWPHEEFVRTLQQRNCIGIVIENDDYEVCGYAVYELEKKCLSVLNFAVAPEFQRQGFGTALCDKLKSKIEQQRRDTMDVCVAERNLTAQLFLKSQDFRAVEVVSDRFDGCDAYRFVWTDRPIPNRSTLEIEAMAEQARMRK